MTTEPTGKKGRKPLRHVDDLLTPKQLRELRRDLDLIARQRREAEAFAATFVFGATDPSGR